MMGGWNETESVMPFLEEQGIAVLRFWDSDIDKNMEGVFEIIAKHCGIEK